MISGDNSITDRVVLRELKSNASVFIKQQLDKRRLWATNSIFTTVNCLEMIEVPTSECCEYVSDTTWSRSKHRLPKIGDAAFGLIIQGVYSADGSVKIDETTLASYINYKKLYPKKKKLFYLILDGYLYVTSPLVAVVKIVAYFEDDLPRFILYPECPCSVPPPDPCMNPLDYDFKCPGFLESPVVTQTIKMLMETYFRTQVDHTSDNKDDQTNKS